MSPRPIPVILLVGLLGVSPAVGLGIATGGTDTTGFQDDGTVVITALDLPTEMEKGQTYDLSATIENRGDTSVDLWVAYSWDGFEYITFESTLRPGEQRTEFIGRVTLQRLADDLFVDLEAGSNHEHGVLIFAKEGDHPDDRGQLFDEQVVAVSITGEITKQVQSPPLDDVQPTTATPASNQAVADDAERPEEGRSRGFFSNSGDDPPFISNVFNLTVLGFVLSIVGLMYQMFEGR